jgi:hypothetical protein
VSSVTERLSADMPLNPPRLPVAGRKVLPELCEVLGGTEAFCLRGDMFADSLEE